MTEFLRKLWSQGEVQDIAEYAVMLAVILVLVVGTIRLIGGSANNVFLLPLFDRGDESKQFALQHRVAASVSTFRSAEECVCCHSRCDFRNLSFARM